jgi:hypothetical protein
MCYLFVVASKTDQPETASRFHEYAMLIILTVMTMNSNSLFIYASFQQHKGKEIAMKIRKQSEPHTMRKVKMQKILLFQQ